MWLHCRIVKIWKDCILWMTEITFEKQFTIVIQTCVTFKIRNITKHFLETALQLILRNIQNSVLKAILRPYSYTDNEHVTLWHSLKLDFFFFKNASIYHMMSLKSLWLASSSSASRCRWFTRTGRRLWHLTGRDDWTDKMSQIRGDYWNARLAAMSTDWK